MTRKQAFELAMGKAGIPAGEIKSTLKMVEEKLGAGALAAEVEPLEVQRMVLDWQKTVKEQRAFERSIAATHSFPVAKAKLDREKSTLKHQERELLWKLGKHTAQD